MSGSAGILQQHNRPLFLRSLFSTPPARVGVGEQESKKRINQCNPLKNNKEVLSEFFAKSFFDNYIATEVGVKPELVTDDHRELITETFG